MLDEFTNLKSYNYIYVIRNSYSSDNNLLTNFKVRSRVVERETAL